MPALEITAAEALAVRIDPASRPPLLSKSATAVPESERTATVVLAVINDPAAAPALDSKA